MMDLSTGQKIKTLRKERRMTQEELGRRVGLQRAAIQKYEINAVENIPIKTIEKLASLFGVTPTYLLGWEKNEDNLINKVKTIQAVQKLFGKKSVEMLELFTTLNSDGQQRVIMYVEDISNIRKYLTGKI